METFKTEKTVSNDKNKNYIENCIKLKTRKTRVLCVMNNRPSGYYKRTWIVQTDNRKTTVLKRIHVEDESKYISVDCEI